MAPVTWDPNTPLPGAYTSEGGTEPTPTFEPADFGEGEGERTVVVSAAVRPASAVHRPRPRAIAQLQELTDKAFDERADRVRRRSSASPAWARAG